MILHSQLTSVSTVSLIKIAMLIIEATVQDGIDIGERNQDP